MSGVPQSQSVAASSRVAAAHKSRTVFDHVRDGWQALRGRVVFLFESKTAVVGLAIVVFWIAVTILAPVLAPYPPNALTGRVSESPSMEHLMGTDYMGRDVCSRLVYGGQTILLLAPICVVCAEIIGATVGLTAGFLRGMVDEVILRILDAIMAFPMMLLYMIIMAATGPSKINIVGVIAFSSTPGVARLMRGLVLEIRDLEFVQAARLRGESALYIMFREILPNCLGPLIVDACLRVGYTSFWIGSLGFLGIGVPPPDPDWGRMVSEGRAWILTAPWIVVCPSLAVSSLVIGLNLLADGISEASKRV